METKTKLEEIDKEIDKYNKLCDDKEEKWDISKSWSEYKEHMGPEWKKLAELSRERRLIESYELKEMSTFGDQMSLKEFIGNCEDGGFIDYDGFGYYTKDGKESDIIINPSDVKYNKVRTDFDSIIWFNR